MKNHYFKRTALALGLAAFVASSAMAEDGAWRNVNHLLKNPAFIPGWSGALTAVGEGVGEVYNGPFEIYQVIPDLPAGEYTLTANAHYRYATNDLSKENMKDGANHNAYLYLGSAKTTVEGLFDKYETAPNNLTEAKAAYEEGKYLNTVKYNHPGGDLRLGIANTGGRQDEWCAFDNFKLTGPAGDVAIPNGDFSEGLDVDKNQTVWNCANIEGSNKSPDANRAGGVYRKTNASPYNIGQQVELEPGKYRFGVQSFLRYGGGNTSGKYITVKNGWEEISDVSAYDRFVNGEETDHAYIYATDGWDTDDNGNLTKPASAEFAKDPEFGNPNAFYAEKPIMSLFAEKLEVYPENEPTANEPTAEGYEWCDSGFEYQAAAVFVKNPDLYRNYVEFELPAKTKVWVGIKKDKNAPTQYWNPFRDFTLEKWDASAAAVDGIELDENAPVEYFNLQGVRVANPENGVYIVKKGNSVSKQIIR